VVSSLQASEPKFCTNFSPPYALYIPRPSNRPYLFTTIFSEEYTNGTRNNVVIIEDLGSDAVSTTRYEPHTASIFSMSLRNVGIYLLAYTASQPRRRASPTSPPRAPQISVFSAVCRNTEVLIVWRQLLLQTALLVTTAISCVGSTTIRSGLVSYRSVATRTNCCCIVETVSGGPSLYCSRLISTREIDGKGYAWGGAVGTEWQHPMLVLTWRQSRVAMAHIKRQRN
jgi:hypothetical protein